MGQIIRLFDYSFPSDVVRMFDYLIIRSQSRFSTIGPLHFFPHSNKQELTDGTNVGQLSKGIIPLIPWSLAIENK